MLTWVRRAYTVAVLLEGLSLARNFAPAVFPAVTPAPVGDRSKSPQRAHATDASVAPFVSVVLPARNEAENIVDCAHSLLTQTAHGVPVQVIVVDDASTDATGTLLDTLRDEVGAAFDEIPGSGHAQRVTAPLASLTALHLQEKPQGWAGKTHALHRGSALARGEWLLFTDADTRWQPGAVEALVAFAETTGADLVTVVPHLILPTLTERIVVPTLMLTLLLTTQPVDVRHPQRRWAAGANGQCILVRRAAYKAVGGFAHPALRGALLDDSSLARVIKAAGYRLQMARGQRLLSVRMYPTLADAWQGWVRSLGASFQMYPRTVGTGLFLLLGALTLAPYALVIRGLMSRLGGSGAAPSQKTGRADTRSQQRAQATLVSGGVALGVTLASYGWVIRGLALPLWYTLLHPIGVLLQLALLGQAWLGRLRGKPVVWKARAYRSSDTLM